MSVPPTNSTRPDGGHQRHRRLEADRGEECDHLLAAAGDAEKLPQAVRNKKGAGDEAQSA